MNFIGCRSSYVLEQWRTCGLEFPLCYEGTHTWGEVRWGDWTEITEEKARELLGELGPISSKVAIVISQEVVGGLDVIEAVYMHDCEWFNITGVVLMHRTVEMPVA